MSRKNVHSGGSTEKLKQELRDRGIPDEMVASVPDEMEGADVYAFQVHWNGRLITELRDQLQGLPPEVAQPAAWRAFEFHRDMVDELVNGVNAMGPIALYDAYKDAVDLYAEAERLEMVYTSLMMVTLVLGSLLDDDVEEAPRGGYL